jgi:N-acetylneuraminic acid mutarotase
VGRLQTAHGTRVTHRRGARLEAGKVRWHGLARSLAHRVLLQKVAPKLPVGPSLMSGWTDLTELSYRVRPRVNHSLTAVPPKGWDLESDETAAEGQVYLFGGDDGTDSRSDLWVFDIATQTWDEPAIRGTKPTPRSRHTATLVRIFREELNADEDRIYVYGGVGMHTEHVMYLDLRKGEWVTPPTVGAEPLALLGHAAAQIGSSLWIFGGRDNRRNHNAVWQLETNTHEWSRPTTSGSQPQPTSKFVMASHGERLVCVLGELPLAKVYLFDTARCVWLHAAVSNPELAPPLHRASAARVGKDLHVFGGLHTGRQAPCSELWALDLEAITWHRLESGGHTPTERVGHTMTSIGPTLFMLGGLEESGVHTNSFASYDAGAMVWMRPKLDGASPAARVGHTMVPVTNERLVVYGGASGGQPLRELYVLNTRTSYWERAAPQLGPGQVPSAQCPMRNLPTAHCPLPTAHCPHYPIPGGAARPRRALGVVADRLEPGPARKGLHPQRRQ